MESCYQILNKNHTEFTFFSFIHLSNRSFFQEYFKLQFVINESEKFMLKMNK